jgi:hypothetical protein
MLVMLNAAEAWHYQPLYLLDHRGVREFVATAQVQ